MRTVAVIYVGELGRRIAQQHVCGSHYVRPNACAFRTRVNYFPAVGNLDGIIIIGIDTIVELLNKNGIFMHGT